MLQQNPSPSTAMTMFVAVLFLAIAGCCSSKTACTELAIPHPTLKDAEIQQCLTNILADEAGDGARYSLDVRAGARDLIVERHLVEFAPLLRSVAARPPRGDIVSVASRADALYALSMLHDPDAVRLNTRYVNPETPPLLLSGAIGNLTLLKDIAAAEHVKNVVEMMVVDDKRTFVMVAALRYLSAAKYSSLTVCRRLNDVTKYIDGCGPRCNPATGVTLRQSIEQYKAVAGCDSHS